MSHAREIKMPKDKKEGLENFLQMIINELECGNPHEALLLAVDLRQDLSSGIYSGIGTRAEKIINAMRAELEEKHAAQLLQTRLMAFAEGQQQARLEIAQKLGIA